MKEESGIRYKESGWNTSGAVFGRNRLYKLLIKQLDKGKT